MSRLLSRNRCLLFAAAGQWSMILVLLDASLFACGLIAFVLGGAAAYVDLFFLRREER
jgi:hypothetical protein